MRAGSGIVALQKPYWNGFDFVTAARTGTAAVLITSAEVRSIPMPFPRDAGAPATAMDLVVVQQNVKFEGEVPRSRLVVYRQSEFASGRRRITR